MTGVVGWYHCVSMAPWCSMTTRWCCTISRKHLRQRVAQPCKLVLYPLGNVWTRVLWKIARRYGPAKPCCVFLKIAKNETWTICMTTYHFYPILLMSSQPPSSFMTHDCRDSQLACFMEKWGWNLSSHDLVRCFLVRLRYGDGHVDIRRYNRGFMYRRSLDALREAGAKQESLIEVYLWKRIFWHFATGV